MNEADGACGMAEEAARLFQALSEAGEQHVGPECRVCPICRAIAALRRVRPQAVEHLVTAAIELAAGLRELAVVIDVPRSATDPGRGDPGRGDPGRGDPGGGDPGGGDPGGGDPGGGDPEHGGPGSGDPAGGLRGADPGSGPDTSPFPARTRRVQPIEITD